MADRDQVIAKEVEFLKGIQTVDDLKANLDGYISSIKTTITSAVEDARAFADAVGSMSEDEKREEIARFVDDDYLMPPVFTAEMQRIDDLPGAIDYMETVELDFDAMFDPLAEEFTSILNPFVQELMSDAMGAMFDELGDMVGEMFEDKDE